MQGWLSNLLPELENLNSDFVTLHHIRNGAMVQPWCNRLYHKPRLKKVYKQIYNNNFPNNIHSVSINPGFISKQAE